MAGKNDDRSGLFLVFFEPVAGTSEAYDSFCDPQKRGRF